MHVPQLQLFARKQHELHVLIHETASVHKYHCVQADEGQDIAHNVLASGQIGSLARTYLTDSYLRRLGRMPVEEEDLALLI